MRLVLAGILIFFFLALTRALTVPDNNPSTANTHPGMVVSVTPGPSQDAMQLHQLPIVTPTLSLDSGTQPTVPEECIVPSTIASSVPGLVSTILQKFGVHLGGSGLNLARATTTYETMCLAFLSPTFQKNLHSLQHPVTVNFVSSSSCFAWTYASPPHTDILEPCPTLIDKYIVIHELVHQMQFGAALGRDAHFSAWQSQVWNTEKNHRIPTGPCVVEDIGDGAECEADAVAEYMYYKVYRNSWAGNPAGGPNLATYPTQWPLWYNFVRDNFFGGVTY